VNNEDSTARKMVRRTCSCHHRQPIVNLPFPLSYIQPVHRIYASILLTLKFIASMCLPCFTWDWAKHEDPLDALESMPQHNTWLHDGQSWVLKPTVGLFSPH
jgi:hypothetical protein